MTDPILSFIPHRPPFLYVHRLREADADGLTAEFDVRADEPFAVGHYPGNPIMPGVLVLECLFQAGALFLSRRLNEEREAAPGSGKAAPPPGTPVLTRIGNAKFRRMVRPGDTLSLAVKLTERAANAFRMSGTASVAGETAAKVEFTCALVDAPPPA